MVFWKTLKIQYKPVWFFKNPRGFLKNPKNPNKPNWIFKNPHGFLKNPKKPNIFKSVNMEWHRIRYLVPYLWLSGREVKIQGTPEVG